ncbi:MAG: ATP-binding cassette domain-containing protein, partial [Myxococcota bacterium]
MSANYVVELENVTKRYAQGSLEVMALRGLTLRIQSGEFTTLVGPSGSGKTTALNLIGALDHPSSGSIRVEGQDLSELGTRQLSRLRRDRLGFVFQAYNLMPVLSAYENAEIVLSLQGVEPAKRRDRVMKLLADVGLEGLENRRPHELSGGQQQRVAIARAIAS